MAVTLTYMEWNRASRNSRNSIPEEKQKKKKIDESLEIANILGKIDGRRKDVPRGPGTVNRVGL